MKIFKKTLSSFMAMATVFSAVSLNTFADETGGFTSEQIENSSVKPVLSLSSECISLDEAKANPTRKISLSVSGASKKYSSTGVHIFYDSRLEIPDNIIGNPKASPGEALDYSSAGTPKHCDYTISDMKGIFLTSADNKDLGLDGVMWTIDFKLPDDVKAGDVFPIDIRYDTNVGAKDLFINRALDETGRLMQAYAFTKGIYNQKTNYNFTASNEDIAKNSALADIDKSFDGYIAIEDEKIPTTTTTATQTTTPPVEIEEMPVEAGNFSMEQIENSPIKPVLSLSNECISLDEAKANPTRKIKLSVSGANEKYAATGIHIFYDKRLTIQENDFGEPDIKKGEALEYLEVDKGYCYYTVNDMNGIFIMSSNNKDLGLDGVMWEISFILPDDVKAGDVFPIDIRYEPSENAKDLFINRALDEDGRLMQAYAFTKGIYNSTTNNNFAASAEDIAKNPALADIDKSFDGYIAIEGSGKAESTVIGDANGDETMNMADATLIVQHVGNKDKYKLSEQAKINVDVDGTPGITGTDALVIQKVIAGLIDKADLPLK